MSRHLVSDPVSSQVPDRRDQQLRMLRFLETLQQTLAGCRNELDVCSSAVHRVAAALDVQGVCLASYDHFQDSLAIVHSAGDRQTWDEDTLRQAIGERRSVPQGQILASPVIFSDGLYHDSPDDIEVDGHIWGVLAVQRNANGHAVHYSSIERQTLRGAAERIARELEDRRLHLLEDVLDSLLRKTKPIDVYMHALRELRRFVRYDHSATILTMQRGMAQLTVRAEKLVRSQGYRESLADSPRRGRQIRLTAGQARAINQFDQPFLISRQGDQYYVNAIADTTDAPGLWHVLGDEDAMQGSVLCFPLIFGGQVLGIMRLASARPTAFEPIGQFTRVLGRFARLLAVTLYRSELYYQSDHQLQAIKQIGRVITEPIPVEEICQQVLQLALRVMHVQVGAVGLLNEDGHLDLVAHQGCTLEELPRLGPDEGISSVVIRTGRSQAVSDVGRAGNYVVFNARVRSELIAPIIYDREVIGILSVASYEVGHFREEDEEVITFIEALANQAAIAIKTAQLRYAAVKRLGDSMQIDPTLSAAGLQGFLIEELQDKIEQLGAANERLVVANRAKSEFLARMSHDLRGPLNVIVGLANLLTDPAVTPTISAEKQRESLEIIRSSGEVLGSLIGNILDLSALEAGKVQLNLQHLDAQATFHYLRSMIQPLAEKSLKVLNFEVAADPRIERISVDEEKFLRIMLNLVSNAVKFTPSGGRVEVMAVTDSSDDGQALHVIVADSGIGIPEEHHETIFEPFRRIGASASGQGTGLGLAVVRQLVELHGGRVWVESTAGQGSSFHLHLPNAVVMPQVEAPAAAPPAASRGPVVDAVTMGSKGTVLVVEDTAAHMDLMRLAVTSRGYSMHGVASGEEALSWLEEHRPDVILLDMQLPGMDGFSVAAEIKGGVDTYSIPVIAVTADALSVNEERARASGCDAYLTKPIDIATLLSTIDAVAR